MRSEPKKKSVLLRPFFHKIGVVGNAPVVLDAGRINHKSHPQSNVPMFFPPKCEVIGSWKNWFGFVLDPGSIKHNWGCSLAA